MKTNLFNLIARSFNRTVAMRTAPNPQPQSSWAGMEGMESRTMMSAAPGNVYTVTFGGSLVGVHAAAHRGGINIALADGSVR